jgi:hypothetical protein
LYRNDYHEQISLCLISNSNVSYHLIKKNRAPSKRLYGIHVTFQRLYPGDRKNLYTYYVLTKTLFTVVFLLLQNEETPYRGCPSKILVSSFSRTGLVKKRSTPLANASCCTLADDMPVSATMTAGRSPFARSKARMRRVASSPWDYESAQVQKVWSSLWVVVLTSIWGMLTSMRQKSKDCAVSLDWFCKSSEFSLFSGRRVGSIWA